MKFILFLPQLPEGPFSAAGLPEFGPVYSRKPRLAPRPLVHSDASQRLDELPVHKQIMNGIATTRKTRETERTP